MTLKTSQYLEVMKEYDDERLSHRKESADRLEEVYKKYRK